MQNAFTVKWKLVDGPDFDQFRIVLDNVMKERAKMNIGGINCALRAGDEYYYLRKDTPEKDSHLSFRSNESRVRCLVYTKTNDRDWLT